MPAHPDEGPEGEIGRIFIEIRWIFYALLNGLLIFIAGLSDLCIIKKASNFSNFDHGSLTSFTIHTHI